MNLSFHYDPHGDVLTVEGVQYAGEYFRFLAALDAVGRIARFSRLYPDGPISIELLGEPQEAA